MIISCVESATFSFMLNGSPVGRVVPTRGLRQGDPISPYLFLFVTEGLTCLLARAEANGEIQGHQICSNASTVSHLFFADDSVFFCKASTEQAQVLKDILILYERASGQRLTSRNQVSYLQKGFHLNVGKV